MEDANDIFFENNNSFFSFSETVQTLEQQQYFYDPYFEDLIVFKHNTDFMNTAFCMSGELIQYNKVNITKVNSFKLVPWFTQ